MQECHTRAHPLSDPAAIDYQGRGVSIRFTGVLAGAELVSTFSRRSDVPLSSGPSFSAGASGDIDLLTAC